MKILHFTDKNTNEEINLGYSDYGKGQPIILIHGWPSSKEMWEYQVGAIVDAGYRVIKYDRRGFGKSSKPWTGYEYDTLAGDLHELIQQLDLNNVILVGFSMGGGEVARYIANHGEKRIARIALIASVLPFMLKTTDNPEGIDQKVFDGFASDIKKDRMAFLDGFGKNFFNEGLLKRPLSAPLFAQFHHLTTVATQQSTLECAKSFSSTDFRQDVKKITVPTLIVHGDKDQTVPIEVSSRRTAKLIPHADFKVYEDAPHGLFYTHREQLNQDLIQFFSGSKHAQPVGESRQVSVG